MDGAEDRKISEGASKWRPLWFDRATTVASWVFGILLIGWEAYTPGARIELLVVSLVLMTSGSVPLLLERWANR